MAPSCPRVVFVLAGQSNMAGRCALELAPQPCPAIVALSGENGNGCWRLAAEPLHAEVDAQRLRELGESKARATPGTGPGLYFALHLLSLIRQSQGSTALRASATQADDEVLIGLVPTAVGGTSIDAWVPGAPLFEHMVVQTSHALALASSKIQSPAQSTPTPGPPTLAAVLWHQGESDADTPEHAAAYGSKLASLLRGLRAALGTHARVPVVVCGIGGRPDRVPHKDQVRAAQLAACAGASLVCLCIAACLQRADATCDNYPEPVPLNFLHRGVSLMMPPCCMQSRMVVRSERTRTLRRATWNFKKMAYISQLPLPVSLASAWQRQCGSWTACVRCSGVVCELRRRRSSIHRIINLQ